MRAKKVDRNHAEVVQALRKAGATVQSLASVGRGCPDLLAALNGINFLFEVKDGELPPSARDLTPDQRRWIGAWKGSVYIVRSPEEAVGHLRWPAR